MEDSSIYKFEDKEFDETVVDEEGFQAFFPKTLFADSKIEEEEGEEEETNDKEKKTTELKTKITDLSEDDLYFIVKKYSKIYNDDSEMFSYAVDAQSESVVLCGTAAMGMSKEMNIRFEDAANTIPLGNLCYMALQVNNLEGGSSDSEIGSSNISAINGNEDISFQSFHFGYNAAEASTAIPVVNNLLHKVHNLLQRWPGNHILFEIVRAGDHILRMSSKSSLYQILVNIENLSRKSQAWEQVSVENSALLQN